ELAVLVRGRLQVGAVADRVAGSLVAGDDGAGDRLAGVLVADGADDHGRRGGGVVEPGAAERQWVADLVLVAGYSEVLLALARHHIHVLGLHGRPGDAHP